MAEKKASVKISKQTVNIPTYKIGNPDKNPMFLEKRVYQGSSGVVYPLPVIESISDEKKDQPWDVVFLENKYIKTMIMPSLGGRIQMAVDKTNNFNFIYYNQVIKPALVGLAGPWISGGIEFNWPQHHRPSTYEPIDYTIEEHQDGSKTLWVSEIERMFRTKCTAGFTLHPDKAYIEINVRLYNRTEVPQTFLWWANPAMHVDENYQSIFPPDVHAVFDHGKRDISRFPIATGTYYKIDYSSGVDISRFKNVPVPTSYMVQHSDYDFLGGYDHGKKAGMLHVANHHVSPGKKQWVWGSGGFGDAWHRNLTDEDGPYVELMGGVFTDNQPDFSWLMPHEEKTFTQYFMPYKEIANVKNASIDAAISLEVSSDNARVGVYVTGPRKKLTVLLTDNNGTVFKKTVDLDPADAFIEEVKVKSQPKQNFKLTVLNPDGSELISYQPEAEIIEELPKAAQAIGEPSEIQTNEQLYLAGLHLEQYRHATFEPEPYYQEALNRDPSDIRNNNALGMLYCRRGRFEEAEKHFNTAIQRQIKHNPNPYDGEMYYNLGLSLKMQNKLEKAYNAFFKSVWNYAQKHSGYFALAQIDSIKGDYKNALDLIDKSIIRNYHSQKARHLKIALLRKTNQLDKAKSEIGYALELDKLDFGAINELYLIELKSDTNAANQTLELLKKKMRNNVHTYIEISLDYAHAGLYDDTIEILERLLDNKNIYPMVFYYLAFYNYKNGNSKQSTSYFEKAASARPDYCFPHRLESIEVLQTAIEQNPSDSKAPYYLGNLWYSKKQYDLALNCWEASRKIDDTFATVHRNLGLAYYNKKNKETEAVKSYEKAYSLDCTDARILYELDQLYKKICQSLDKRLEFLRVQMDTVRKRDDLFVEYLTLLNLTGQNEQALNEICKRSFHPWEGGEGKASGTYVFSLIEIAKKQFMLGQFDKAIENLQRAKVYPYNLAEGKLFGHRENDIDYLLGCCYERLNDDKNAAASFEAATVGSKEPADVWFYNDQPPEKIFYQGAAFRKLGDEKGALSCFNRLTEYGQKHYYDKVKIDYFAVSLPDFLIFDEDLQRKNKIHCLYVLALGNIGLYNIEKAKEYLDQISDIEPAHAGAIVFNNMIKEYPELI